VLKKQLGKRIAALRRAAELTQAKLAEKSGYPSRKQRQGLDNAGRWEKWNGKKSIFIEPFQ
jgi:transcriptional regulator with XRE-family HTH domain